MNRRRPGVLRIGKSRFAIAERRVDKRYGGAHPTAVALTHLYITGQAGARTMKFRARNGWC